MIFKTGMKMKNLFIVILAFTATTYANGQVATLTLDSCYARAMKQYPLIQQRGLIDKSKEYNVSNVGKGYLPQLSFGGQATYQSAVTAISLGELPKPLNTLSFPTPSKDQYNIHGEVDQVIYDGGMIKDQKNMQQASADIQQQNINVQLYALKDRINQLFFGALLIEQQIKQNELVQKDIQSSIDKMQAAVNNGTALQSNLDELQAELLQQQQNNIQLKASRKAYFDMLGLFINQPVDESTILHTPETIATSDSIKRPELLFYDYQKKSYDVQNDMLTSGNMPHLSFFFQGGYAKPGLNAFDTKFETYYIGGFRLSWSLGGFYTLKNSRQLLSIDKQTLDIEKETFLFNTRLELKQQSSDIVKLQEMISKDNDIIQKRTAVKNAAKAQLDNGVITVHDYISELDAEDQAKQGLLLHQVQLLMAEYSYRDTSGN